MDRFAKIVATIGPSCRDKESIQKMVLAGMNVARLNFSHGTHQEHAATISLLRSVALELNQPVTILQDLQGPKMRVGDLPLEGVFIKTGGTVVIIPPGSPLITTFNEQTTIIPVDVPELYRITKPGNRILMDDGQIEVKVVEQSEGFIRAIIVTGGLLKTHKGVNLPGANIDIPAMTEKDFSDLEFGLSQGVDAIAISFVQQKQDIQLVRDTISKSHQEYKNIPIIAKLERPGAISNLDSILEIADGVMVARGDLGVETSPASVPIIQKTIIQKANASNRLVITATQMLDSMTNNPRPTRAEASDVANAIFDGTDAVMLSGETAAGRYPIESIQMMDSIVREAEAHYKDWGSCNIQHDDPNTDDATSLCHAAKELAHDRNVAAIAVFTLSGKTAAIMSKVRPNVPIFAFTPNRTTYQKLNLYWGVKSNLVHVAKDVESMLRIVDRAMQESTQLKPGQQVILLSGLPLNQMRPPNFALLHTIGEPY